MKCLLKVFVGVLIILVAVQVASAQIEKGDKELSIAASFMSVKSEHDDADFIVNIPIRLGFFATPNVEVEPEFLFTKWEEEDVGFVLSGNVAYNYVMSDPESKTVPFLFAGFGYSNALIYLPNFVWPSWGDESWTVMNVGGGFKFFMAKQAALRCEYRFQKFFGEDSDFTYHNIFLGVSAFPK